MDIHNQETTNQDLHHVGRTTSANVVLDRVCIHVVVGGAGCSTYLARGDLRRGSELLVEVFELKLVELQPRSA